MQSNAIVLGAADDEYSIPFFDPEHPESIYLIHLDRPSEREVAVELILRSNACTEGSLMKDIKVHGIPYTSVPDSWPAGLPEMGKLEFAFVKDPRSPAYVVLDWKKIGALEANFKKAIVSESSKLSTVLALAPCSNFYAAQIARLLRRFETGDNLITAACSLYVRCMDLEDGVQTIMSSVPARDVTLIKERLGYRACFRGVNPTGHYALVRALQRHIPTYVHRAVMAIADATGYYIGYNGMHVAGYTGYRVHTQLRQVTCWHA